MIKVRLEVCLLDVQEPILVKVGEGVKENVACGYGALLARWEEDNDKLDWRIFGYCELRGFGHRDHLGRETGDGEALGMDVHVSWASAEGS